MRLSEVVKADYVPKAQREIKTSKKKQKRLAQASAGLGVAALATKTPGYAAAAARRVPQAKRAREPLARVAARSERVSGHLVPLTLGVGAVGSANFARLQGREAKEVGKASGWRGHVSPAANNAYRDLGERKRRRETDAAAHTTLAGGTAAIAASNIVPRRVNAQTVVRGSKPLAAIAGGLTVAGGYNAGRRMQEARSLEGRRKKIKAKGRERRAQTLATLGAPRAGVSKAEPDVVKALRIRRPRPGGLMRLPSGRSVTRRGSIPGTVRRTSSKPRRLT